MNTETTTHQDGIDACDPVLLGLASEYGWQADLLERLCRDWADQPWADQRAALVDTHLDAAQPGADALARLAAATGLPVALRDLLERMVTRHGWDWSWGTDLLRPQEVWHGQGGMSALLYYAVRLDDWLGLDLWDTRVLPAAQSSLAGVRVNWVSLPPLGLLTALLVDGVHAAARLGPEPGLVDLSQLLTDRALTHGLAEEVSDVHHQPNPG